MKEVGPSPMGGMDEGNVLLCAFLHFLASEPCECITSSNVNFWLSSRREQNIMHVLSLLSLTRNLMLFF